MGDRGLWRELRRGLAATAPYLLSHHEPHEYDRCYLVSRRYGIRLCARCTGVYPGIVLGLVLAVSGVLPVAPLAVVALGPAPALLDWVATTGGANRGSNAVRTLTGGLLGLAYGVGLVELLLGRDLLVLAVGVVYALLAGGLLSWFRPWSDER